MTTFTDEEVNEFFTAVHGYGPFPWQVELARRALAGDWPDAVDAPTGLGKTWSIDIAVLAMAAAGLRGDRAACRRIFFVVDRRTVVDEAHQHTTRLADALHGAPVGSLVAKVACGLRRLLADLEGEPAADVQPLLVTRMRGGATWDDRWLDRPDQPAVVISTVDQIGSRMLFRGYGVSDRMRPIDAAMAGTYGLLLLDEAHLARPFANVLGHVTGRIGTRLVPGLSVVSLSATQRGQGAVMSFDVESHLRHDEARRRLTSDKRLAIIDSTAGKRIHVLVEAARHLARSCSRVLVVCNTVADARAAHSALVSAGHYAGLLTGRARPADRELVAAEWVARMSGPEASGNENNVILVATQTVEVGVNLDVDALVTQECALDALIQRLGRVNRFGTRVGSAVVVATGDADPVYQEAAPNTTDLLRSVGTHELVSSRDLLDRRNEWLNVSPLALRELVSQATSSHERMQSQPLVRPEPASPLLDPSVIAGWAATSPVPFPDVPIEPHLHGLSRADRTVLVAWRSDLPTAEHPSRGDDAELSIAIAASECVELPISAMRAWLANEPMTLSDLEGSPESAETPTTHPIWVVKDGKTVTSTHLARLRTGDTIVIPSEQGGLDRWGWAPESSEPVLDVADLVERRGSHRLRLDARTLLPLLEGVGATVDQLADSAGERWHPVQHAIEALERSLAGDSDETVDELLAGVGRAVSAAVSERTENRLLPIIGAVGRGRLADRSLIVTVPAADHHGQANGRTDTSDAEDQSATATAVLGKKVTLEAHGEAVGRRAHAFAASLGLTDEIAQSVRLAAEWHDLGKLDRRFQAQLWGGVAPYGKFEPLAKSGMRPGSQLARRARALSGYPSRMRHETLSAALARARLGLDDPLERPPVDPDLLVHLIASHHGFARPNAESVDDPDPEPITWASSGTVVTAVSHVPADDLASSRFASLNARYGYWGLALLESLVRMADITCSREGS